MINLKIKWWWLMFIIPILGLLLQAMDAYIYNLIPPEFSIDMTHSYLVQIYVMLWIIIMKMFWKKDIKIEVFK